MGRVIWTRRYNFQSVHSLSSGALRERLHGHHYFVEVSFTGREIDSIDATVEREILAVFNGHVVTQVQESTGECVVNWIHDRLLQTDLGSRVCAVALQETRKNRFVSARTDRRYV